MEEGLGKTAGSQSGYSINDVTLVTFIKCLSFSAWKWDTNSHLPYEVLVTIQGDDTQNA